MKNRPFGKCAILVAVVTVFDLSGCNALTPAATDTRERGYEEATRFFVKGARIGMSPDAGLYKKSEPRSQWDHVATIHSLSDDMALCQTIAETLNAKGGEGTFVCRLMNE